MFSSCEELHAILICMCNGHMITSYKESSVKTCLQIIIAVSGKLGVSFLLQGGLVGLVDYPDDDDEEEEEEEDGESKEDPLPPSKKSKLSS